MTRGGSRVGKPGASYSNRTDLNEKPMRTAPIATPPSAPITEAPGGGAPSVAGGQSPNQVGFNAHPTPPGSAGAFNRPTERPTEPLTHGAPFGPGAGPEIMPPAGSANSISNLLAFIGGQSQNASIQALAADARSRGQ